MLPTSDRFRADMDADIGPTSTRFRADVHVGIGQRSQLGRPMFTRYSRCRSCIDFDGLLLSGLLNDFESKKENLSFENYIYDQEYFDMFNIYDKKHIAMYLNNLYCFN